MRARTFISKKFKQYISTMGINIKGVLVKAYNSINIIELILQTTITRILNNYY